MKIFKKLLLLVFIISMVTGFAGCAKDSGRTDSEKTAEAQTAETNISQIGGNEPELSKTYTTSYQEVNSVTYPPFSFDYPENWTIKTENVTQTTETVVLTNNRGVQIEFDYYGNIPEGTNMGTSTVVMQRVEVSKAADSSFIPRSVQGSDHSDLGNFMVAQLKVTGQLNMKTDSKFEDVDGTIGYAVIPESYSGVNEDVRGPFKAEFVFWYSGYISFTAMSPDGTFTDSEQQEVIAVLSTFRVV